MFVKWRPAKLTRGARGGSGLWDGRVRVAHVVESVRTPAGPRHRQVCYVASYRNLDDGNPQPKDIDGAIIMVGREVYGSERYRAGRFWETATRNLDRAGIAGDDRARIEAALERVVPRPAS